MNIDPKIGFWLNIVYTICMTLVGVGWATVFDTKTAGIISLVLSIIAGVVNSILHGYSAPAKGPLAS